jgi:LETM1 and EF-hand domain-containing protein 1
MAKFLQDAVEEMSATGLASPAAKEFADLYKKARITGEALTIAELERVCQSLKDSLTIDNLDRAQLVSLCKYMDVKAFGTDAFLRYQVRKALTNIYRDDEEILKEGVDSLYTQELENACRIRGLFYPGINESAMRKELNLWLDLHLKRGIPSVLLILSRALTPNMSLLRPEEALKDTILSLSDAVVNEAELHQRELGGSDAVSYQKKLEVLEQQQDLIAEELAQERESKKAAAAEYVISRDDLKTISETIQVLSSKNPVELEAKELAELKADMSEFKIDAEKLEYLSNKKLKESKASEIIGEKLGKMVNEIEAELLSLQDKVGDRLQLLCPDKDGSLTMKQLEQVFRLIRDDPSESERLQKIIESFDTDKDGKVLISDIVKMVESAEDHEGHGRLASKTEP